MGSVVVMDRLSINKGLTPSLNAETMYGYLPETKKPLIRCESRACASGGLGRNRTHIVFNMEHPVANGESRR